MINRNVYTFIDALGRIGGFLTIFWVLFSTLVYPMAKINENFKAIEKAYIGKEELPGMVNNEV